MDNGMDKAGSRLFLGFLLGLVALMGGLALAKGGLYVDRHEGDTLHLTEIVLRMAGGEWPHLDHMSAICCWSRARISGRAQGWTCPPC